MKIFIKKDWLSISLAFFAFVLPWQIKLILRPGMIDGGQNNFLEIALYGSALILLVFIGFAIFETVRKNKIRPKLSLPDWLLISFLAFLLLAVFFAAERSLALDHYFYFFIGAALLFFSRRFQRQINWRLVLRVFLLSCLLSAILGIFQFTIQRVPQIKYLVAPHQVSELAGESVLENSTGRLLRAYGSFEHPNIFGGVMAIALLLTIEEIMADKREKTWRVLMLSFFVFFWALLVSFSRAAWLAFSLGMLARLIFARKAERAEILLVAFFAIGAALLFFGTHPSWLDSRIEAAGRLENASIQERVAGLKIASSQIITHPWSPVGLGNYVNFLTSKFPGQAPWVYQPAHNVWLLMAAEDGCFAMLAFLALWFFSVRSKAKKRPGAIVLFVAFLTLSLFDHWLISLPFGILFGFFVLSVASGDNGVVPLKN